MSRFFVDKSQIGDGYVSIIGDDVKHISRVLRLREGDEIIVCDKCGMDYTCALTEVSPDKVLAKIICEKESQTEPEIEVTLYQGLPKSDKMDYIVQKCVELGISKIVPVITKRVVALPRDTEKKISRWQKISYEAAKQSGRGVVPEISDAISFDKALSEISKEDALGIMPYECERDGKLSSVLKSSKKKKICILIGPEGGFDESEVVKAQEAGVKTVTLGPRILRTETAPLAVLAAIMYELQEW